MMRGVSEVSYDGNMAIKRHKIMSILKEEAKYWRKASELNIAPLMECHFEEDGEWVGYIKTERFRCVGSGFLRSLSRSDKDIIARKIVEKLLLLNENGIAHRDIHTENIVVRDLEPLILDWEFATDVKPGKSYDLFGEVESGVPRPQQHSKGEPIFWGFNGVWSLSRYLGPVEDHM